MSTRIPPTDPEEERKRVRQAYETVAQTAAELPVARAIRTERSIADMRELLSAQSLPSNTPGWITTALQSVTLVTIVGCAFWLGSLSNTVTNTSQKLDKLNDGIAGISKDSVSNRLIAIETKLDSIEKKLDTTTQSRP
jgi:hypothetical protein